MKEILVLGLLALSSSNAFADVYCASAAGYYANINARVAANGDVNVTAMQGYAHELSSKLGVGQGREWVAINATISRNDCETRGKDLRCASRDARVLTRTMENSVHVIRSAIRFSVIGAEREGIASTRVTLALKPEGAGKVVGRMIDFGAKEGIAHKGLGECSFD